VLHLPPGLLEGEFLDRGLRIVSELRAAGLCEWSGWRRVVERRVSGGGRTVETVGGMYLFFLLRVYKMY